MANTKNLNLYLTNDSEDPTFGDWRKKINGEGTGEEKSNFQKIDDAFGSAFTPHIITSSINFDVETELNEADTQFFRGLIDNMELLKGTVLIHATANGNTIPLAFDSVMFANEIVLIYKMQLGNATMEYRFIVYDTKITAVYTMKKEVTEDLVNELITEEVGDIETALDGIIAIQNTLIGGGV